PRGDRLRGRGRRGGRGRARRPSSCPVLPSHGLGPATATPRTALPAPAPEMRAPAPEASRLAVRSREPRESPAGRSAGAEGATPLRESLRHPDRGSTERLWRAVEPTTRPRGKRRAASRARANLSGAGRGRHRTERRGQHRTPAPPVTGGPPFEEHL